MASAATAIALPGLEAHLGIVPPGSLVLLEGGLAPGKNHAALAWAVACGAAGRKVAYLHTDPHPEVSGADVRFLPVSEWDPSHLQAGEDLAVDSFSLLHISQAPSEVAERVRGIKQECRRNGTTALLVLDDGQLPPAAQAACQQMADGVVQFGSREDADGLVSFLRVPKWVDGRPRDRHIFYAFDGKRLLVDTRRRVN